MQEPPEPKINPKPKRLRDFQIEREKANEPFHLIEKPLLTGDPLIKRRFPLRDPLTLGDSQKGQPFRTQDYQPISHFKIDQIKLIKRPPDTGLLWFQKNLKPRKKEKIELVNWHL